MLQWYDELPHDPEEAFVYMEALLRERFLSDPPSDEGMRDYMLQLLVAKRELEQRGLRIALDWHFRNGYGFEDLNLEMIARFKRPFDRKMFESFSFGVRSVLQTLDRRGQRRN